MNWLFAKTIQALIPARAAETRVAQFLQKIRRRSFRMFCDSIEGYFSQAGQDKFINESIFKGKRAGTFVEIGAADGVLYSNTYYFEKELGWTGICVEPRPDAFAKLTSARKCLCLQACVTDKSGEALFLNVENVPLLSGLLSKYDPRHLERVRREAAETGSKVHEIAVRCYTFRELVSENAFRTIDYLSIDTEGGELDLLRSIDFASFDIRVVSVENTFANGRFEATMNHIGYDLIAVIGDDDIYSRRSVDNSV